MTRKIQKPASTTGSVSAKNHVPIPAADGWFIYIQKNLRTYPDTLRSTPEWDSTYKIRTCVARSINHVKNSFGLAGRKTQDEKTLHAYLLLSGITQLITVLLADKMHQHQYIRSVKSIIA